MKTRSIPLATTGLLLLGLVGCAAPPTLVGPRACGEGERGVVAAHGRAVTCYPAPVAIYMACAREVGAATTTSQDPSTTTARARGLWFCEELARAQVRGFAPPQPAPVVNVVPAAPPPRPAPTVTAPPAEPPPPRDDYGF